MRLTPVLPSTSRVTVLRPLQEACCQRCSCRFTCPLEIITCFLCGVGDGTNVSYVRQVLYHLATLLAPKPILRVVSIKIYFFP